MDLSIALSKDKPNLPNKLFKRDLAIALRTLSLVVDLIL